MDKICVPSQTDGKKFSPAWKMCIGTGRLSLALQKEYLDALKIVKENIDFSYIRGHGLLCDDIGIYREDEVNGEIKPFYNFTYIDRIIDSYLELGIRPFVELGFMPQKLASGDQTVFYWKGNVTPPKDYDKWSQLIQAVVRHFISRYGFDEVRLWPFEVWNEPNMISFWKDADMQEYFKLYKVTAHAVKAVDSRLQVGGPAICGGSDHWITEFLNFCYQHKAPIDFLSRHAYTSSQPMVRTSHFLYQEIWECDYMLNEFKTVRQMIKDSPFPELPFHITEYNTSWHPLNPVHDTVFNAAYLARILSEGGDHVDSFSYWTFSDVFEEQDIPRAQFHGGFGLLALNDIPKPTFHLFSFFSKMGEQQLYRDENMLVTRRKDGTIALVAWNPIHVNEPDAVKELEITIPCDKEKVFMKRQTVNEAYGNPLKTWMQMGRPRFPGKELVETLKLAAQPYFEANSLKPENGAVHLQLSLSKNEVTLIELMDIEDETETYIGLDDSWIGY